MGGPVDWTKQGGYPAQGGHGAQQPYPQPPQGAAGHGAPGVPPTHAGWAVSATLFFWPLAFTAWSSSSDVVRLWVMGDLAGSQAASDRARRMGKIALWIGIGGFVLVVVLYAVLFAVLIANGDFSSTSSTVGG